MPRERSEFTEADRELIAFQLSDKIAPSTVESYKNKGVAQWQQFLVTVRGWDATAPDWPKYLWLQSETDTDDFRTQLFILYASHLRRCGVTDLGIYFKALAHDFNMRGLQNTAKLLSSALVLVARQFGQRREAKARAQNRELGKSEKDATSGRMLMSMYKVEWTNGLVSGQVMVIDQAVGSLIGWVLAQFGLRISNLARTESVVKQRKGNRIDPVTGEEVVVTLDQHVVRAQDVSVKLEGVDELVSAFSFSHRSSKGKVIGMIWTFWSSKSNQRGNRLVRHQVTNRSEGERMLLEMCGVFMWFAQFDSPEDIFFSRPQAGRVGGTLGTPYRLGNDQHGRYIYQQKDVSEVVKACASRFGLDPDRFSTKSFKNLGISTLQNNREELGMSEEEVAKYFDHASIGSNRHYQRKDMFCRGPLSLLEEEKLYDHENLVLLNATRKSGVMGGLGSTSSSR